MLIFNIFVILFVNVDLCLIPIRVRTFLSPYIKECNGIIYDRNFTHQPRPNATAIDDDCEDIFNYVKMRHEKSIKKELQG